MSNMHHLLVIFLLFYNQGIKSRTVDKIEFCSNLYCEDNQLANVCGLRKEGGGYRLRLFINECELLKYGCEVAEDKAYGIINLKYCKQTLSNIDNKNREGTNIDLIDEIEQPCNKFDCIYHNDAKEVCGISQDGNGFRVRMFLNKCQLLKYNCINNFNFTVTEYHICNGVELSEDDLKIVDMVKGRKKPNIIIVDANMFNVNNNINDTIDNFFAATHVYDLPIDEVYKHVNESTRRLMIDSFGPQEVFKPWVKIPKNISEDYYHMPTLSSCFHKCPRKCPDTYAPVCGQAGIETREPSLVFQNHCYMDAAQCKMKWENKSPTSISSAYIESSFMFCLGDSMNMLFRFLPLVRTLQHMGRFKKKGSFNYKFKNLKYINNILRREPKLMGR